MIIIVASAENGPAVRIEDPEDLDRFHTVAERLDGAALDDALDASGAGGYKDGHAWINRRFIEEHVADQPAGWPTRFAAMLEFAEKKGWLSPDGELVRTHVEWR